MEIPWKLHVNRWEVAPLFRCNLCSSLQQLGVRFLPCPLLSSDRLCSLQDSMLLQECQRPYKETSEAVSLANLHNKMKILHKIPELRFRPKMYLENRTLVLSLNILFQWYLWLSKSNKLNFVCIEWKTVLY